MTGVPGPGPGAAEAFGKFQMCEVPASEDEKNGTKQHSIYGLRAFTRANFPSKTAHLRSSARLWRPSLSTSVRLESFGGVFGDCEEFRYRY